MFANFRSLLSTLLPRMSGWLFIVVLLMAAVWLLAPHQLTVSLYKLSLVTLAAVLGYWLDRSLYPYARPHVFFEQDEGSETGLTIVTSVAGAMMIRRAIIIAAAMIAVSLGA